MIFRSIESQIARRLSSEICSAFYLKMEDTGFPIKDARFSKLKNVPNLVMIRKITENID